MTQAPKRIFPAEYRGELALDYMGCSFTRNRDNGILSMPQESHADKLIERFKVITTNNPFCACLSVEFGAGGEDEEIAKVPYREGVRGFLWLSGMTRSDTSHAVRSVAAQSHDPSPRHWSAIVEQILVNLVWTRDM